MLDTYGKKKKKKLVEIACFNFYYFIAGQKVTWTLQ